MACFSTYCVTQRFLLNLLNQITTLLFSCLLFYGKSFGRKQNINYFYLYIFDNVGFLQLRFDLKSKHIVMFQRDQIIPKNPRYHKIWKRRTSWPVETAFSLPPVSFLRSVPYLALQLIHLVLLLVAFEHCWARPDASRLRYPVKINFRGNNHEEQWTDLLEISVKIARFKLLFLEN